LEPGAKGIGVPDAVVNLKGAGLVVIFSMGRTE
jgi:hypothetical protein